MSLSNLLKRLAFAGVLASSLNGCAYINYFTGNYAQYLNEQPGNQEKRDLEQKILSKAKVETIGEGKDKIRVLYAQGTPYEVGFQHGRLLRDEVRANVGNVLNLAEVLIAKSNKPEVKDKIRNGAKTLAQHIPEHFKEEMKGLADGAGITFESVQFLQCIGDIVEHGCSNYVLSENATDNKEMLQVRILDFPLDLEVQRNPLILVVNPDKGNPYTTIGWAGFIGTVTGLNKEKIALGEMRGDNAVKAYRKQNNIGEKKETLEGMLMPFLLRDILQFDTNLEQVTERLKNTQRTNCYVYVISDGKTQDAKAYITDKELFEEYNEQDFLKALSAVEPETEFANMGGTVFGGHNNGLINNKIKENYGRINEELLKQDFNPALAMKDNLQISIYNLTNMTIQVANAEGKQKACERNYVFLDLKEAFDWFNK